MRSVNLVFVILPINQLGNTANMSSGNPSLRDCCCHDIFDNQKWNSCCWGDNQRRWLDGDWCSFRHKNLGERKLSSNCWWCGMKNNWCHNGQTAQHDRTRSLSKAPYNYCHYGTEYRPGWSVRRLAGKSYVNRRRSNCWWCGKKNNWCHNCQTAQHDRTHSLSKVPYNRCRCGTECRSGSNAHQSM